MHDTVHARPLPTVLPLGRVHARAVVAGLLQAAEAQDGQAVAEAGGADDAAARLWWGVGVGLVVSVLFAWAGRRSVSLGLVSFC
jgi:hypothetical protein